MCLLALSHLPPTHPFSPTSLSTSPYWWPKWHFSSSLGGTAFRVNDFTSSTSETLAGRFCTWDLGKVSLKGNNQWLCFSWRDRQRERRSICEEWCARGTRGSTALCQCVWEEVLISFVSATSKIASCQFCTGLI